MPAERLPDVLKPSIFASVLAPIVFRAKATDIDAATLVAPNRATATAALPTPAYRSIRLTALTLRPCDVALCVPLDPTMAAYTDALPRFSALAPAPLNDRLKPPVAATPTAAETTSARTNCVDFAKTLSAPERSTMLSLIRAAVKKPS